MVVCCNVLINNYVRNLIFVFQLDAYQKDMYHICVRVLF
jgi:hypothetical protein